MWLAEDIPLHDHDPGSPPLEGGEALCEFTVDSCNQELQHLNVLRSLPSLLEENKATCIKDVFSKIQAVLPNSQAEVQLEASNSFLTILERELVPATTFTQTFLQSILTSVDSRDPIVANAWLETLMDVIDLLPPDIVKKDILSLAIYKGQHSQSVTSRLASCKILGKISLKFEAFFIKKEILPTVQSLCQDVDYEIRSCIAYQLDAVARGLGLEIAKYAILPWLVELSNDEASYVRVAAIETVVNMLSLLDDETCTQTIIPLVKKFCETSLDMEDAALPIAAKQLGRLCHGLSLNLQLEEKRWFLYFYRQLAKLGLPVSAEHDGTNNHNNKMPDIVPVTDDYDKFVKCRQNCAYNFPAMVLFAEPNNFKDELLDTFYDLASDPHSKVRRTMASGIHEVAKLLGPNVYLVQRQLVLLLQDDCLQVLEGVLSNLPVTLEALAREGSMNSGNKLHEADDVICALIACERAISSTTNWRLHAEFLTKLSCLPRCLSNDDIHETFVPLIFQKLYTARPIPCRMAATRTLLVFLRNTVLSSRRQDIVNRLIDDLGNNYSCHKRMLFITACSMSIELFSKQFFKNNFFTHLLRLADDPIPNIRLRLCSMLPKLKSLIKLPADQRLLYSLEAAVRKLVAKESDKDVSTALRNAILELDKVEIVDLNNRHSGSFDDAVDVAKEDEEKLLVQLERKLKIRQSSDKDLSVDRTNKTFVSALRSSKIPSLEKKTVLVSSGERFSPSRNARTQRTGSFDNRSAIPTVKRSSLPLTPSLNRKVFPDSPIPSPETIRRVSAPNSPMNKHSRFTSSDSFITNYPNARYNTKSVVSSPPLSPPNSSQWLPLGEQNTPSDAINAAKYTNNKQEECRDPVPRCNTPPLFGKMQSEGLELEFSDDLIIAHLSPNQEERYAATPAARSNGNTNKVTPRRLQEPSTSTPTPQRKFNSIIHRNNTEKNPAGWSRMSLKSDDEESQHESPKTAKNKSTSAMTRAKSTSHLSPAFSRKLGPSLIPRASFRSPTGRSPSAPGTPRCMSPVRLHGSRSPTSSQRMGLSLPLSQDLHSRLAGRKFFSRPGSPASLCSDSDGQNTPDSPCSYGSNDSIGESGNGRSQSRARRLSGSMNSSKIPFLIPRTSLTRKKSPQPQ